MMKKKSHLRGDSVDEESSGDGGSEGGSATEGGGVRPLGGRGERPPENVQAEDDDGYQGRQNQVLTVYPLLGLISVQVQLFKTSHV